MRLSCFMDQWSEMTETEDRGKQGIANMKRASMHLHEDRYVNPLAMSQAHLWQ